MEGSNRQAESRIDLALALHKIEAGFALWTRWTPGDNLAMAAIAVRR